MIIFKPATNGSTLILVYPIRVGWLLWIFIRYVTYLYFIISNIFIAWAVKFIVCVVYILIFNTLYNSCASFYFTFSYFAICSIRLCFWIPLHKLTSLKKVIAPLKMTPKEIAIILRRTVVSNVNFGNALCGVFGRTDYLTSQLVSFLHLHKDRYHKTWGRPKSQRKSRNGCKKARGTKRDCNDEC